MTSREEASFVINILERLDVDIISIQGSIGAGKSTVLDLIETYINENNMNAMNPDTVVRDGKRLFVVMPEPLKEWDEKVYCYHDLPNDDREALMKLIASVDLNERDAMSTSNDENIPMVSHFDLFNINPQRYALSFQMIAKSIRLSSYFSILDKLPVLEKGTKLTLITDRSMLTDQLFAENLEELGIMSKPEYCAYKRCYDITTKSINSKEKTIIYVPTDVKHCQDRIKKRGRLAEQNLPTSYLESLDRKHKELIHNFNGHVISLDLMSHDLLRHDMSLVISDLMKELV